MTSLRWLFRLLRLSRDVTAVRRGRVPQRLWNRAVSRMAYKVVRKLYR